MHNCEAVIFDMDGLLIDSEPLWRKIEVEIFNNLGVPLNDDMCKQTTGIRVDEAVDYWYERYPWELYTKNEIIKLLNDGIIDKIKKHDIRMPGTLHSIQTAKAMGCKIAIASSATKHLIDVVVDKLGIGEYFDLVYSAENEIHGKPYPGVYLTTAKKLGVDNTGCVVLEDSLNGVLSAKAANMKCIAVPDKSADKKVFSKADLVLDSLEQITADIIYNLFK